MHSFSRKCLTVFVAVCGSSYSLQNDDGHQKSHSVIGRWSRRLVQTPQTATKTITSENKATATTMGHLALFEGTSQEIGRYFHIKVDDSLGVKLINCDDANDLSVQFYPGYAVVGGFTSNIQHPMIQKGDIFVAVNGHGFRRFAHIADTEHGEETTASAVDVELDHAVIPADGTAYQKFMEKLKAVKLAKGDPPLTLTLIRFGWDARCFAWRRFLVAREGNVPAALELHQNHVQWKLNTFPMDIASPGLQAIFSTKAVAQVKSGTIPTVYVNYNSLIQLEAANSITSHDIVNAFIMATERMLSEGDDPRYPRITHLIDVSGTTYTNFRMDIWMSLYNVFEPNYPETLHRLILYPMSTVAVSP